MDIIALNRCWVIHLRWLLVTLMVVAALLGLAFWQLQRAAYKTELLQRFAQLQQSGAVNAQTIKNLTQELADGLQISASAHWLSPGIWLLDNQMLQGRIGYDVIVPMQLNTTGEIFLVNLGWVAAPMDRAQLPRVNVPTQFNLQGVLRVHPGGFRLGKNSEPNGRWPMRIQQIDIDELSAYLKQPLYSGIIYQLHNTPYVVHYKPVVMSPERHRAYALQWVLLAVAVIIIAFAASLKRDIPAAKEPLNARQ